MSNFLRGSEWRKWDMHVHVPDTKLSNCYEKKNGEIDWDRFCQIIHDSDVEALGITDYFSLESYFTFIDKYKMLYPNDSKVFFPNLELRLNESVNRANEVIDFHIIFRPDITKEKAISFLDHLKTQMSDSCGRKIVCRELETDQYERATVSRSDIEEALGDIFGDKLHWIENVILIVPANNDGIRADNGSQRKMNIADEIDKFSNAFFGNPSNISYFLSTGRYEDEHQESIPKPVFSGSDSHSFSDLNAWLGKEMLSGNNKKYITWIKADLTFQGLQQTLLQPEERVFIGSIPPSLKLKNQNKQNYISSVSVNQVEEPINKSEKWFEFTLPLNSGLVSVIGNKGSGKSALSDVIALFANCKTIDKGSFLNEQRFKKENKRYACDYVGQLTWEDGKSDELKSLNDMPSQTAIENAQYLPQRYIEEICNDLGNGFKDEINRVIFSYIGLTERGRASNLEELIEQKTIAFQEIIEQKTSELKEINSVIIGLEDKLTESYKESINNGLEKYKEKLERHKNSKPEQVIEPDQDNDPEYLNKLKNIEKNIKDLEGRISEKGSELTNVNIVLDELNTALTRIENIRVTLERTSEELLALSEKYSIPSLTIETNLATLISSIQFYINTYKTKKDELAKELDVLEDADNEKSLIIQLKSTREEKESIVSIANEQIKVYQKYLDDLHVWEEQKNSIIGSSHVLDSLEYYKHEKEYIDCLLYDEYKEKTQLRSSIISEIFSVKGEIAKVYSSIYAPVEKQLNELIVDMGEKIRFVIELSLCNKNIGDELLRFVNKTYSGIFGGADKSYANMKKFISATDFNNFDSVNKFIENVLKVTSEDPNTAAKKVKDREAFYEKLCSLKYIDAQYNLTVDNKHLEALSPGEKGIVLLVFYLALSKDERPLIIDQPEDNLDNQSVFCNLVECIKKAKKKRQVIIVTHNPNIAVACDSEQIVYCSMDKNTYRITYKSGSIENPEIKDHVIDVLEGTMPAFDLRRKKYSIGKYIIKEKHAQDV